MEELRRRGQEVNSGLVSLVGKAFLRETESLQEVMEPNTLEVSSEVN